MADDTTLNSMTGGDTIGADEISGVKYQRIKLITGADGVNDGDVSSANGLPVELVAGTASIGKLGAGTASIGKLGANSGVDIGDVTLNGGETAVGALATVTGLESIFDSDGDNSAQVCKAAAGRLYAVEVSNINTEDTWLQLFDVAAGSVTVGTTTPKLSLFIPKGDGTNYGAMDKVFTVPIKFATAITYALTTTPTGSGDPTTGLTVNLLYI